MSTNKIQVTEALRLKKEISTYFNRISSLYHSKVYFGTTTIDNVKQNDLIANKISASDYLTHLETLSNFSEEINDKLSNFNRTTKIDSLVRRKSNLQHQIDIISLVSEKSVGVEKENTTITGTGEKVKTITKFTPTLNVNNLKEDVLKLKSEVREIQNKIDKLNLKTIDLSFDFEQFEKFKLV